MRAARWLRIKARAGRALLVLLIVTAAAGVLWYRRQAAKVDAPPPSSATLGDSDAEMVTSDFRHVETRMDRTIWVLEAARAEIFGERAKLRTVKISWYGQEGMTPVFVTSDYGEMNFKTLNATLNGRVLLRRADGSTLATEQVLWYDRGKLLRAPGPVVITTPNFTFRGRRLDADLEDHKYRLDGEVQGEIRGLASAVQQRPS